jgi:hypothetical protein
MSWDDFNAAYNWAKILDGETQEIAVVGSPHKQERDDGNLSLLFNIFNFSKDLHEVLRCGVVLAGKIKGGLKGGELIGTHALIISRTGSTMDDTEYSVKSREMSDEEKEKVGAVDAHDLTVIPLPDSKRKRRGKKKPAKK